MQKKTCPICYQSLDESHYCEHCKKTVRKPVTGDVEYDLKPDPAPPETITYSEYLKKLSIACGIIFTLVSFLVITMGMPWEKQAVMEPDTVEETTEEYVTETKALTEEDMIGITERCSGQDHFLADGLSVAEHMRSYLEEGNTGYVITGELQGVSNCLESSTNMLEKTYYKTRETYYLSKSASDTEHEEYLIIDYDSVTGELHSCHIVMRDLDILSELTKEFILTTAEYCGKEVEDDEVDDMLEEALSEISSSRSIYIGRAGNSFEESFRCVFIYGGYECYGVNID